MAAVTCVGALFERRAAPRGTKPFDGTLHNGHNGRNDVTDARAGHGRPADVAPCGRRKQLEAQAVAMLLGETDTDSSLSLLG